MLWKSPFITRWAGFRNRNRATVSARQGELETVVTVTTHEKISVKLMREGVARYYKTDDVSLSRGMKTDRHAKYRYEEL
jgi:hypothetical protein